MYEKDEKAVDSYSSEESQTDYTSSASLAPTPASMLVRKVDFAVVPLIALIYLLSSLDRTNIGNARLAGLQKDLNLNGHNYRIALSVTYVPYILAEIPSNLIIKKVGPDRWIPTLVVMWGMVTALQGCVTSFHGLIAARFFLGMCEGGIYPGLALYLSMWYQRHELQFRISLFFASASLAGAFGGLLAAAIEKMDGIGGKGGWAWIFILEGCFTVLVGLLSYFLLPSSPAATKILDASEREQLAQRIASDVTMQLVGAKSTTDGEKMQNKDVLRQAIEIKHKLEEFHWHNVTSTFKSPFVLLLAMLHFCNGVMVFSLAFFLPTLIKGLGYAGTKAQLMSVPPFALACVCSVIVSWVSDRVQMRMPFIVGAATLAMTGYAMIYATGNVHVDYAAVCLMSIGSYCVAPAALAWTSNNLGGGHYKKATALGLMIVMNNTAGIVATWIYEDMQAPRYPTGHLTNVILSIFCIVFAVLAELVIWNENRAKRAGRRDYLLAGMDEVQAMVVLADRHPHFYYML